MTPIQTEVQFNNAIQDGNLTVVKFYTNWCPDCRRLNTFIGDIMSEHQDKAWFEMNGEDFPELAEEHAVRGVPSLLVYRNGKKIGHLHSKYAKTPEEVREFLAQFHQGA